MMKERFMSDKALSMGNEGNAGNARAPAYLLWNPPTVCSSLNNFKGGERR